MTKESDNFERRIERINRLLAQEDAIVTWNDFIPDPDNPDQLRQVDITIKKNNEVTHVECRFRSDAKHAQDVKWVEELIGRRLSLQAHRMIAVSSSGFTKGAQAKAEKYGIELRELNSLSDDEIRNWCYESKLLIDFYQYNETKVYLLFAPADEGKVSIDRVANYLINDQKVRAFLDFLFERIKKELLDQNFNAKNHEIKRCVVFKDGAYEVDDVSIKAIIVSTKVDFTRKEVCISSILAYTKQGIVSPGEEVTVETFPGNFEIGRSLDECYITFDFSSIDLPRNSQFVTVTYDLGVSMMLQGCYMKEMERINDFGLNFTDIEFNIGSYLGPESSLTLGSCVE